MNGKINGGLSPVSQACVLRSRDMFVLLLERFSFSPFQAFYVLEIDCLCDVLSSSLMLLRLFGACIKPKCRLTGRKLLVGTGFA